MDRSIRRLGLFLMVLFCALFAQLNYIQVFRSTQLNEKPGNSRPVDQAFAQPRGTVTTADGVIVARSVPIDSKRKYLREFPEQELYAHVTGYFNYNFGATGLEAAYNDELAGTTADQQFQDITDLWQDRDRSGNLQLTIRSDLQKKAREALGDRKGSVVALDPRNGAVLALWSWPSYDPNALTTHDDKNAQAAKAMLEASPDKPLLARTYRELYAPGSTFKVVTAAPGVETGPVTVDSPDDPKERSFTPPQTQRPLPNFGGSSCGGTLFTILARSCNTSFARMGLEIGGPDMIRGAEAFGFNERPPFDLPAVISGFPVQDFKDDQPKLAQSAIGQRDVTSSPLQMALVAAAIANGGKVPAPHVVDKITDQDNRVIRTVDGGTWKTAVRPETAAIMRDAMRNVVTQGTVTMLQTPGVDVGGKSGTAQIGDTGRSHAWVIAWAIRDGETEPFLAVAVLVENQSGVGEGTGGKAAGPIVKAMIDQALQPMPAPPTTTPATTPTTAAVTTTPAGN